MADLSEEEIQVLAGRLNGLKYECAFPRAMYSVLEDVFYLVDTARWHLKRDGHSERWRENIAFQMYQLQSALRKALEAAGEIEKRTGLSGRELAPE